MESVDEEPMEKQTKKIQPVFLGIIVVLIGIMWGSSLLDIGGGKTTVEEARTEEYALAQTLTQIEGVGKIAIYYYDGQREKEDSLTQYFSLSQPTDTHQEKEMAGILVVAEGGGDPVIQNLLSKTLSTVLQLPEHQIVIVEMKQEGEIE